LGGTSERVGKKFAIQGERDTTRKKGRKKVNGKTSGHPGILASVLGRWGVKGEEGGNWDTWHEVVHWGGGGGKIKEKDEKGNTRMHIEYIRIAHANDATELLVASKRKGLAGGRKEGACGEGNKTEIGIVLEPQ